MKCFKCCDLVPEDEGKYFLSSEGVFSFHCDDCVADDSFGYSIHVLHAIENILVNLRDVLNCVCEKECHGTLDGYSCDECFIRFIYLKIVSILLDIFGFIEEDSE